MSAGAAVRAILDGFLGASARRTRRAKVARAGADGAFPRLKAEVKRRGLLQRQPAYYAWKCLQALAFLVAACAWAWAARGGWALWFAAPLMAFAAGQVTLLGHDAAHRAVFASARANDALALACINALNGGSYTWWAASHNEHHARSGDLAHDPDLDYPFLAFSEAQAARKDARFRFILARQHWLVVPFTTLVGVTMRAYSLAHLLRGRGRAGESVAAAAFYLAWPAALVGALGCWRGLAFMALHQALYGLYLASITAPNHWGMPMPEDTAAMDFVRHQATTSRNLAGGALVDLWYGGLNRQIEHHLFPSMPRNRLREAREVVRPLCAERGIPYREVGPWEAYREIYRVMRRVARAVRWGEALGEGGAASTTADEPLDAQHEQRPHADQGV